MCSEATLEQQIYIKGYFTHSYSYSTVFTHTSIYADPSSHRNMQVQTLTDMIHVNYKQMQVHKHK